MKKMMLGNEAVALGARDGGCRVISSYPGTPSTEITESAAKYDEINAQWAANEKVAAETAMGACVAGARAMCCMKHVGLNVAADVLFTAAYTGVNGGLVFVVADDPGMASSQNEQDSRYYAMAAHVPMIEPADAGEAYDFARKAFEISEQLDMPVILRLTTRISHTRGLVDIKETKPGELKDYSKNIPKYVMMPAFARARKASLLDRIKKAEEYSENSGFNRVEKGDGKIGIVCSGACYLYVKEALPDADILKIGMSYPLPENLIKDFAKNYDKVYVVEEQEPVYQKQLEAWGIKCVGHEIFPRMGEFSPTIIKSAIEGSITLSQAEADLPIRPPVLCPGCPHRAAYYVMNKLKLTAFGDIGCYTLGAAAPLSALDSTICMGASIGMAHGAELARGREFAKKSVAVIGDSTFMHSGLTGIASASYNNGNITVLILDNGTTGMTGHQDHPATGRTLKGEEVKPVDIERACYALGASNVRTVDPFDIKALEKAIRQSLDEDGVSVVVARRQCVLLEKSKNKPLTIDQDKCIGCGVCLKTGCPALIKGEKTVSIDRTLCNGCGLCSDVCPTKSIGGEK